MRLLQIALLCFAFVGPAHGAAPVRSPETLSFAELYRMTVLGTPEVEFPGYQIKVAAAEPQPAAFTVGGAPQGAPPRYAFSTPVLPEPSSRWLLMLSGLALAAWVARRKLGYSL